MGRIIVIPVAVDRGKRQPVCDFDVKIEVTHKLMIRRFSVIAVIQIQQVVDRWMFTERDLFRDSRCWTLWQNRNGRKAVSWNGRCNPIPNTNRIADRANSDGYLPNRKKHAPSNCPPSRNTGYEISLGGDIIRTNDWNWSVELNISHNKNELKNLYKQKERLPTEP